MRFQVIQMQILFKSNQSKSFPLCSRLSKSQQHLSDSYERFNETKSYHSRSTCGLYSISSGLESLPDPLSYTRKNRIDPDRLNILDWPDPPRRYRSVQNLDTVSGLVDIVEDNWPIEGNRSIDCIYTQVKYLPIKNYKTDNLLHAKEKHLSFELLFKKINKLFNQSRLAL